MEELREMVKAMMESLIEMTTRAVKAEEMEAALRANITKLEEDKAFWRKAYDRAQAKVEELEGKNEEH